MKKIDSSDMLELEILSLLENPEVQDFLAKASLSKTATQPGNTIGDRLRLIVNDNILGKAMEDSLVNDRLRKFRTELQRQGVEIYTSFFLNPPVMKRPLLICSKCLLIWSPVFDPLEPIPRDIGRCPQRCNEHLFIAH